MKIIASTQTGYLCELSRREISLLGNVAPKIDDTVELERAFDILDSLRGLSRANITYLGDNIKKLQERYAAIQESYDKVMLFDSIKNKQDDIF